MAGALGGAIVCRICDLMPTTGHVHSEEFVSRLEYQRIFRLYLTYSALSILIATLVGLIVGLGLHFFVERTREPFKNGNSSDSHSINHENDQTGQG